MRINCCFNELDGASSGFAVVPGELPRQTAEFIREHIDSLEQLEILLLLSSAPEKSWSVAAVYERIRSNPQSIARRLERMRTEGLLAVSPESPGEYCYQPASPQLTAAVQELSRIYKERRVTVIEQIFAEPPSPIQGFADAFRIRKEEDHG